MTTENDSGSTTELVITTVAGGRVSLDVPASWQVVDATGQGNDLSAVEPSVDGMVRTSFVLAVVPVEMEFDAWQRGTDAHLGRELADYVLLDLESLDVGGHPGGRRLATHATATDQSVTMEQWSTLVDGLGVTLTASAGTARYAAMASLIDAVADSLAVKAAVGVLA